MAKEIAKPIIDENTKKYKLESVEFETFTLGSLPPTIQGQLCQLTFSSIFPFLGFLVFWFLLTLLLCTYALFFTFGHFHPKMPSFDVEVRS